MNGPPRSLWQCQTRSTKGESDGRSPSNMMREAAGMVSILTWTAAGPLAEQQDGLRKVRVGSILFCPALAPCRRDSEGLLAKGLPVGTPWRPTFQMEAAISKALRLEPRHRLDLYSRGNARIDGRCKFSGCGAIPHRR